MLLRIKYLRVKAESAGLTLMTYFLVEIKYMETKLHTYKSKPLKAQGGGGNQNVNVLFEPTNYERITGEAQGTKEGGATCDNNVNRKTTRHKERTGIHATFVTPQTQNMHSAHTHAQHVHQHTPLR